MRAQIILFAIFPLLAFGQLETSIPTEPCMEECVFEDFFEMKAIEVPVYIGDPNDLTVRRDVYHLDMGNGVLERVEVVQDLYKVDSYKMQVYKKKQLVRAGGYSETLEVLCPTLATAAVLNQIQNVLIEEDFLPAGYEPFDEFKLELKNALSNFQKANGLPVGHLDFETLDFLEVEY